MDYKNEERKKRAWRENCPSEVKDSQKQHPTQQQQHAMEYKQEMWCANELCGARNITMDAEVTQIATTIDGEGEIVVTQSTV